ncbi:transcription initiation factor TFIID 23-30kDa subunit [Apiospora rasikravindrae]|uniref:Transcription initiation factor TFIID subunit 10 n=1 Tax=Apiospora rasikravindrae TaxID=990691 RepID=A0ABR1SXV2_9PEZI
MASAPTENTNPVPVASNNEAQAAAEEEEEVNPEPQEAKMPTRRDISLKEFLNKMDDYAPILANLCAHRRRRPRPQIPDAVTNYYMTRAGLPPPPQTDQRLARLLALATQKFIADIAADAYQYSRIRASNTSANNPMGNLGAAAGIPIPGQAAGGGGGGAAGGSKVDQSRGAPLGIQRAGYGGGGQGGSQNRTVLTMEDLGMAVGEYGVNVKRSEFYR